MSPLTNLNLKKHKKAPVKRSNDDFIGAAAMDDTVKVPKEPLKHVNINIVVSKHKKFKRKTFDNDETMQQVVEAAIDDYLNKEER